MMEFLTERLQAHLLGIWLFGLKCIQCGLCHLKLYRSYVVSLKRIATDSHLWGFWLALAYCIFQKKRLMHRMGLTLRTQYAAIAQIVERMIQIQSIVTLQNMLAAQNYVVDRSLATAVFNFAA